MAFGISQTQKSVEIKTSTEIDIDIFNHVYNSCVFDLIVDYFSNFENAFSCSGYYDNCNREVFIGEDLVQISWSEPTDKLEKKITSIKDKFIPELQSIDHSIKFTDLGYVPIHKILDENGKDKVTLSKVVVTCAEVFKKKLLEAHPDITFSHFDYSLSCASFTYHVTKPDWQEWIV